MSNKVFLTLDDIERLCLNLGAHLAALEYLDPNKPGKMYAIPRGGIPAAYALSAEFNLDIVSTPEEADFFFDDIIDSGRTCEQYLKQFPDKPFLALIDKTDFTNEYRNSGWIVFPWEGSAEKGIEDNIVRLLQFVGEDTAREGLLETPARVAKAWSAWTAGYDQKPEDVLKVFEDGAEEYDEMVVVKDIPFYSHCEHHMAPFFGTATIAYIPNGKIVGLSKLSRLLDVFARRLQVQERLTSEISEALMKHLGAVGCGVIIRARHMCMESRGVCKQGHHTITSSLKGAMKDQPETRAEFMALAK